jgi:hypothetical protein
MLKEILENYDENIRKEVIEKVKELLDKGECVYSQLLGRVGKVTKINDKGWITFIRKKCENRKNIGPNCYGTTPINSGDPVYLKKEDNCWILTNFIKK